MGWSIKQYPTLCSFGGKLLLLFGVMGVLTVAGVWDGPSRPTPSDAVSVRQADVLPSHPSRPPHPSPVTGTDAGRINVNQGSAEDFRHLPGIGPVLAERIVRYRREHGPFGSIHDMQRVKGIGEKRVARIEPYLHIKKQARSPHN